MEMGVSAQLVIEANKTLPTDMNVLSKQQLIEFRVSFDAHHYGSWALAPYGNGLVAFSRTEDAKRQMTLYCVTSNRAELLITFGDRDISIFSDIQRFALLDRVIARSAIRIENSGAKLQMHIPVTSDDLQALETDKNPDGAFEVDQAHEPRAYWGAIYENLNLDGLVSGVRLVRRNCIG